MLRYVPFSKETNVLSGISVPKKAAYRIVNDEHLVETNRQWLTVFYLCLMQILHGVRLDLCCSVSPIHYLRFLSTISLWSNAFTCRT